MRTSIFFEDAMKGADRAMYIMKAGHKHPFRAKVRAAFRDVVRISLGSMHEQ